MDLTHSPSSVGEVSEFISIPFGLLRVRQAAMVAGLDELYRALAVRQAAIVVFELDFAHVAVQVLPAH